MIDLKNTKVDLRSSDGTIDHGKRLAFEEMVTGGDKSKYCGNACTGFEDDYQNARFLIVTDCGMLSMVTSSHDTDEDYFNNDLDEYREIVLIPEYKVEYKESDEEIIKRKKITEIEKKINYLLKEIKNLKNC